MKRENEDTSSPNITLASQIGLKQAKFGSQPYIDPVAQETHEENDSSNRRKNKTNRQISNSNVSTQLLYQTQQIAKQASFPPMMQSDHSNANDVSTIGVHTPHSPQTLSPA